jgi:DnaJ-class molecular chaperone
MRPYTCPVCAGRGTVPGGFYGAISAGDLLMWEECRSCSGKGLVWTPAGVLPEEIALANVSRKRRGPR